MKKLNALLFNQGGKCFYCDAVLDIQEATIEHVIPQSKGGKNDSDNLVVCCKYANQAFRDYLPKQKIAVIKQFCGVSSVCQKIFPREEQINEDDSASFEDKALIQKSHIPMANTEHVKNTHDISIAYQLLLQAVDLFEQEGREAVSSRIKKKMLELNPSFKESDYGFRQFKKFLLRAQEKKMIILEDTTGNNYVIKKL